MNNKKNSQLELSTYANQTFDTIVVGSGPGGATVANELVKLGQKVSIIEWGNATPFSGTFMQMAKMAAIPGKGAFFHSDLSLLLRGITAGGSSAINFATSMPPPAPLFKKYEKKVSDLFSEQSQ